eukprot:403370646
MFTQRKTNSYDLVGTNARNSDCSFSSNTQQLYGEHLIGRMSFEKSEQNANNRNSNISAEAQLFMPCQGFMPVIMRKSSNFNNGDNIYLNDFADQMLNQKMRTSQLSGNMNTQRPSNSSDRMTFNFCQSMVGENPFGAYGEQVGDFNVYVGEESTHDSQPTTTHRQQVTSVSQSAYSSRISTPFATPASAATTQDRKPQEIIYQTKNPFDLDEIINNDDKLMKLLQEIDFNTTGQKRLRIKKGQQVVKNQPIVIIRKKTSATTSSTNVSTNEDSNDKSHCSAEENKRRKNKDQVKILQNEYSKQNNWTRPFMNDLAKRTGLKRSQVYKWNWDQKKKEIEEQKMKMQYYPSEIFQVTDTKTGKNLTKSVTSQMFVVDKQSLSI